jgi:hypothetical protein
MEELDLHIENYNLKELLVLFNLDYNFNIDDLKKAKKIVLMTHPDKSGLNKDYFLFFTSAYKLIYNLYDFRYKSTNNNTKYTEYILEKNEENEKLLNAYNIQNKPDFNKWFNDMFETSQIPDLNKSAGYGSWLVSDEDIETQIATKNTMNSIIEDKKTKMRSLIIHNQYKEITNTSSLYDLTTEQPDTYSSDIFSKLSYEDLKKAHTESVVPVTIDDYNNRKQYNINELINTRSIQDTERNSVEMQDVGMNKLLEQKELRIKSDMERAYTLAKQDEKIRIVNDTWWSKLKHITN